MDGAGSPTPPEPMPAPPDPAQYEAMGPLTREARQAYTALQAQQAYNVGLEQQRQLAELMRQTPPQPGYLYPVPASTPNQMSNEQMVSMLQQLSIQYGNKEALELLEKWRQLDRMHVHQHTIQLRMLSTDVVLLERRCLCGDVAVSKEVDLSIVPMPEAPPVQGGRAVDDEEVADGR